MLHVVRWSPSGLSHGAVIRQLAVLLIGTSLVGCSLKPADQASRISLVLPNPQAFGLRESGSAGRIGLAPTAWNSSDFKCYGVNIVGSGIADSSKNPDPAKQDISALLSGTKSCSYKGITSSGFVFSAGSTDVVIDLQVPAGTGRVIQLVGITNADHCGANFLTGAAAGSPGAYEIGRRVVDLFGDTTVSIPVTYAQTEDRRVDCGGSAATVVSVSIDSAGAANFVNIANQTSVPVSGTCSVVGETVDLKASGVTQATVPCVSGGTWSAVVDFSNAGTFPEGSLTLTADLISNGVSATTASRTITKDVTAPTSATLSIAGGAAVTNDATPDLTISAIGASEMYVTNTAGCAAGGAWEAYSTSKLGWTLAASNVSASVYLQVRDAAGNVSPCISDTIQHDSVVPTVAISTPAANSYITAGNVSAFSVTGTCSENTRNVVISGAASATTVCTALAWSASLDFTAAAAGAVSISVNHSDAAGNAAVTSTRSFIKDSTLPTVAISNPVAGSRINAAMVNAFSVSGTCSENTRNVVISGDAAATVACTGGAWVTALDFSAAAEGAVNISVNHTDAAGNVAAVASRNFDKDTVSPVVAFSTPTAGSFVNIANRSAFTVSGTCTENTRSVVIGGSGSGTTTCTAGAWSISLNLNAPADGIIALTADHSDLAGNNSAQATRTFTKDTAAPTASIINPTANAEVAYPNLASFSANGTCSENGEIISYSGPFSGTVACAGGTWNVSGDLTPAAAGAHSFVITHYDLAGNPASVAPVNFFKVGAPSQLVFGIATPQAPASVHIDSCYGPLEIIAKDSFNRASPATSPISVTLTGGGVFNFYTEGKCETTATTTATIAVATSQQTIFYRATQNTGATIQASGGALTAATRNLSVLGFPLAATLGGSSPSGSREDHSTIWTGSEMVIWGGFQSAAVRNTGERFNGTTPAVMTTVGAPDARRYHTAVWTGAQMLVWGGQNGSVANVNSGGRYFTGNDTWATMTTTGAPTARYGHSAVFTGTEMIVWGGYDGTWKNDGGQYALADSWVPVGTNGAIPTARMNHAAVWTGAEMLIWGGSGSGGALATGARYDVGSGTWTAMSLPPAGFSGREYFAYAWSGAELFIFGGVNGSQALSDGARYNPSTDTWVLLPKEGAPRLRGYASGAWGNGKFLVAGGMIVSPSEYLRYGGGFDPGTGQWMAVEIFNGSPPGAKRPSLIHAGTGFWIFGGTGNATPSLFNLANF